MKKCFKCHYLRGDATKKDLFRCGYSDLPINIYSRCPMVHPERTKEVKVNL